MGQPKSKTVRLPEILQTLKGLKSEIRQRYKAEIRGIFGSYAKGQEGAQSDLDVLVEFDEGANLLDLVGRSIFLEEKLNLSVDVVPESAIREEIRESVLREAVAV